MSIPIPMRQLIEGKQMLEAQEEQSYFPCVAFFARDLGPWYAWRIEAALGSLPMSAEMRSQGYQLAGVLQRSIIDGQWCLEFLSEPRWKGVTELLTDAKRTIQDLRKQLRKADQQLLTSEHRYRRDVESLAKAIEHLR